MSPPGHDAGIGLEVRAAVHTGEIELEGTGGGVHDVGYQKRGHHSVEATALRPRERRTQLPVDRDPRLITHNPG
ncbi:MAG TPA: hypothetical protein VJN19_03400, partial [Propionibacteriaceae bacterium]|nr:hypothetical protein [Propionibacteriaceae bacterium]